MACVLAKSSDPRLFPWQRDRTESRFSHRQRHACACVHMDGREYTNTEELSLLESGREHGGISLFFFCGCVCQKVAAPALYFLATLFRC